VTDAPSCGAMQVRIVPLPGKRVEHQGIKVQLIGQIELAAERNAVRSNPHDFVSLGDAPNADARLPEGAVSHGCARANDYRHWPRWRCKSHRIRFCHCSLPAHRRRLSADTHLLILNLGNCTHELLSRISHPPFASHASGLIQLAEHKLAPA